MQAVKVLRKNKRAVSPLIEHDEEDKTEMKAISPSLKEPGLGLLESSGINIIYYVYFLYY